MGLESECYQVQVLKTKHTQTTGEGRREGGCVRACVCVREREKVPITQQNLTVLHRMELDVNVLTSEVCTTAMTIIHY
jgi:hypothetical protein